MRRLCSLALLLASAAPAVAQDPAPAQVPAQVKALSGCWRGEGTVMGKSVAIQLSAKPITEGAMFLVEAESHATKDPADRYAAHLVFGGRGAPPKDGPASAISGFWIDSFGGDFTAQGAGAASADGFEIAYAYPDASFINRWRQTKDRLTWTIVAKSGTKPEAAFASYDLARTVCPTR